MAPDHARRRAARFARDTRGNTSIIFGLSIVPIMLFIGAGIDYSRAIDQKAKLQQATDAATLAVTRLLASNPTSTTLQTQAQNYLSGAMNDANAVITSGPTISPNNTAVCMSTRTTLPTTLMRVAAGMGFTPPSILNVTAMSCTKVNDVTYEIALVLDNSGSMNATTGGTTKIASLKTAATQMITTMNPVASAPRASFSIVPFSSAVKIGSQYQSASFMDTSGKSSIHFQNFQLPKGAAGLPASKFDLFAKLGTAWAGCVEERPAPYTATDTAADSANPDTLFVPYLYPDEHTVSSVGGTTTYGSTTNTYIQLDGSGDAGSCGPNDVFAQADKAGSAVTVLNTVANTLRGDTQTKVCKYNAPKTVLTNTSGFGAGFPVGPNLLCDSQPVTTLTNNTGALKTQIQALSGKGDTNLIGGVMWGWRTISPNGPFNTQASATIGNQNAKPYAAAASTTAATNVKVMIVMTDGMNHWAGTSDNNASAYSSLGFYANGRLGFTNASNVRSTMDAQTLQACTNAKAAGVQIYTVGFSIPSDPIDADGIALLQSCATKPSMAYIAPDGGSLIATFQSITQQMSGLRLTN